MKTDADRLLVSGGYASGVEHPFDARVNLFLFDNFYPVGLSDTLSDKYLITKSQCSILTLETSRV